MPWNVRKRQRLKQAFASHVLNDTKQCNPPDATTLKPGVDHEAPYAYSRIVGRRRRKRFILEHDEAHGLLAEVDRAIPGV